MLKVVHFSDLHFGSGERYGTINPETGLNKRFEDFIAVLDKTIYFAIQNDVHLVIFTGDTYKHAVPEPLYQREFAQRIGLLSQRGIPTILLVGNHDVLYRALGSNVLDIYKALDVEHITVFDKIELKVITTRSGQVQVIALPHITKSKLLTKEEYISLSSKEQDKLMLKKVKHSIDGCIQKLDSTLPSILIGHGTIETANFGGEQNLSIGKVLSYPLSYFQIPNLDYVGFGHIHRHQVLQERDPLILYAGSLERVDFGEESEDKGFVYLEIEKGKPLRYKFISTGPREFLTISCDLSQSLNPEEDLEKEIIAMRKGGAVIRVKYKILEEDVGKIDHEKIKELLNDAFSVVIQAEIVRKERTYRISEIDSTYVNDPIKTLEKYLFDYPQDEKEIVLAKAKELYTKLKL